MLLVSQTQPALVFKNAKTQPPLGGLALLDVSEFDTVDFLVIT